MAWLVDPIKRQTMVYHLDGSVEIIPFDQKLMGGAVLPGLELILSEIIVD